MTQKEVAGYIGVGVTWLADGGLDRLYAEGFPKSDPVTGRWDHKAIDAWWDARSGLAAGQYDGGLQQRLEAFRNGEH